MGDSAQQDTDRTPTGAVEAVDVATAASRLGVTPDAIRARLHRGTLDGEKVEGQWRVHLSAENPLQPPTGSQQDTRQDATGSPTADRQDADRTRQDAGAVDLEPLTSVIADLARQLEERDARIHEQHHRIEELAGQEAMWRTHALHLQGRVEQLEQAASVEALGAGSGEASGDQDTGGLDRQRTVRGLWARLVARVRGREAE